MSAGQPFLLVQLSDAHVRDDDAQPERMFADAVRDVAALEPAPGAVLVSGDLTEHGFAHEYERVRELLSALTMPVHVLAGNHDDRDSLRASFPVPAGDDEDYRYTVRCGPLRLVAVDTTDPGRVEGRLGAERLAWLDARLAEERETPTIVAMHHPPLLLGIPAWDAIGLPGGAIGRRWARSSAAIRTCGGSSPATCTARRSGASAAVRSSRARARGSRAGSTSPVPTSCRSSPSRRASRCTSPSPAS